MRNFIEINEILIDMNEIKYCYYQQYVESYSDEFIITLKDDTKIDLSTDEFDDNCYKHYCNNSEGYKKIKEYLIKEGGNNERERNKSNRIIKKNKV